jgi:dihydrolipoamide dehydrogenase
MLCPRATDMIGEMATAIANGLTSSQLMYAMRAHPTFNEAVSEAVENSRMQKVTW